jgi:DNA-directed RNA polymerase specialized sigma24 family protein
MPRRSSKSVQRSFPWRETLLAALRRDPRTNAACKTAGISRNTAYQHLRNDGRFRRQWEHALNQGCDVAYRLRLKQLASDPQYLRTLERFRLTYGSEGKPFLMLKNLVR